MKKITKVIIICVVWCLEYTFGFALAPATVGGIASSAGRLSNTIKETKAWQRLTAETNLIRILPARAMEVVQDVVGSFRQEGRVLLITPNGGLRGRVQTFKSGISGFYYSFRGIRYGEPPIGSRRFLSALPAKPWTGIRNAIREGNACPHRNMLLDTYKGDEDCLFLNVYTKHLPNKDGHPRLPVMVWIHGGGFSFGSGNAFLYGPDFLVAEDIVLVTLNYRLGPLGFLSAGNDAPGNAGIKDQILALKWVQENIAAFGGDPSEVTIFGESAGAASVHFLVLSSHTQGLFHRAISESGSALNPWALAENPKDRAFKLGQVLGFETNNTDYLLAFLRKIPARKLIDYAPETLTAEDTKRNIGLPFIPVIEDKNIKDAIITDHPLELMKKGKFNKVPYITGFNANEAMLFLRRLQKNPDLLEIYDKHFDRLIPNDLIISGGRESEEAEILSKQIRKFYLGNSTVSEDTIDEMINLLTDMMFVHGIVTTARLHAAHTESPTYVYRFAFDGTLGLFKRLMGISKQGVCHGDEMGYLFHFGFFNLSLNSDSPEILVKRRMVAMWTNFAKYGNPTPLGPNDPILSVEWEPVNGNNSTEYLPYLEITSKLKANLNPDSDRLEFWDQIYDKYNGKIMN